MNIKPRQKILESADQLFNQQGIQTTSLADISKAAEVSKGTLFYHFKSKDDLILEIAIQYIKTVEAKMLALIESKTEDQTLSSLALQLINRVIEAKQRNRLHLYLIEESINRSPAIRTVLNGLYSQWLTMITTAIEPWVGERAAASAQVLLAMTDGLIIQKTLEINIDDVEALVEVVFREQDQT
jgi:AcrR family transcriptional regulator